MDNNLIEKELKELLKLNEDARYQLIIDHDFKNDPQKLKYKLDISKENDNLGVNDIFEIYISYKDKKTYIISPNINNYNLDIYELNDIIKISSLTCHRNRISTIKYFIEKYKNNEYLISGDFNQIVIIWDLTVNYNIKYKIDTKYENLSIYSCLLLLCNNYYDTANNKYNENYIITSTRNSSKELDKSATKIYSLYSGEFIKSIKNSNNNNILYLLPWYNKENNNFYIIQFADKKIVINNLLEDELYSELINEPEDSHYNGFIYNIGKKDFLFSSSYKGNIDIWDLYNKKIFQVIKMKNCNIFNIIQWNKKYIICTDYKNKCFKIIDLTKNKIVGEIKSWNKSSIKSIKKIYSFKYGECLFSAGNDKRIKLWNF